MRRFGRREVLSRLMEQIGDDFPIEHGLVSRTIERAQTSVEGHNFDIRKHLLEYDDVLNVQRETIYDERLRILQSDDLRAEVWRMLERQVDEYLTRYEDTEQQRLLFTGLDDVVPLSLPAPGTLFQGPLSFAGHLTAFPPFTVSFLADQFSGLPLSDLEQALKELNHRAATSYGEQIRQTVTTTSQAILENYEERLDRYRVLLDEKIDDYLQLIEERGEIGDPRRLAQHLERTFPLKLTTPRGGLQSDLDDLRDHWMAEVEVEFHRQTCNAFLDRIQIRLPADVGLDRLRPARLPDAKLADEMRRVRELAVKQPRDDGDRRQLEELSPPPESGAAPVLAFVQTIKDTSHLDVGRLDRLVGHAVGAYLDDLVDQYLEAVDQNQGRLKRDLERLRDSVVEGKKGRRANDIVSVLRTLNDLVHLDIPTLEDLLDETVAHEYDKWAQRQVAEIATSAGRNRLPDTTWTAIAEHLLATHYTQKQAYDRDHRRRTTWMPRLPLGFVAQAHVEGMDQEMVREVVLASLGWTVEQREQVWGQQELQRWGTLALDQVDREIYDGLLRFLGEQELGDLREQPVSSLPSDLYDHLRFSLALRHWEERDPPLRDLPHAEIILNQLGQEAERQMLDTPIGELDSELQAHITAYLRQLGYLDAPSVQSDLLEQPISTWDQRTRDEVAGFLGRQFIATHKDQPVADLEPEPREKTIAYLQRQRRFVDEERIQQFLVRQRLSDLPEDIRHQALLYLSRSRLDQVSKRKISNLDVSTRQVVTDSLQRMGRFTDQARRDDLSNRALSDLDPKVGTGFAIFFARQQISGGGLRDLEPHIRNSIIEQLKQGDALTDSTRVKELATRRLDEVDGDLADRIREDLVSQLHADLADKTMEELPATVRRQVHQALDEKNYFIDREKAGWYERKTLAQLPSNLLRGLEQYLGQLRFVDLADTSFRELPLGDRDSVLTFLDDAGLLTERTERLRLTQAGTLGEFADQIGEQVAQYLGRQWLVQIRDRRPPELPERDRELVWAYLRAQGYFIDEFKEELFAYQRLEEFDAGERQAVETALVDQLALALESQRIGDMPNETRARVQAWLSQTDYAVDEARLRQVEELPVTSLAPDLRQAVEAALGRQLLAGLDSVPIAELSPELATALWRYLDEIGYFVDEKKRSQVLDRRLADFKSEAFETIVADLAQHLRTEIGARAVSELDDALRQGLREALEALGYFESSEVRTQVLAQPLGHLRREDLDALAADLGRVQVDAWSDRSLNDLADADRQAILAHLQAREWFLDRNRLAKLQTQTVRDLEADVRQGVVDTLRRYQLERLQAQRLTELDREQRRMVHQTLQQKGLMLEESQMRPFQRQLLVELAPDVYRALLQDIGEQVTADWHAIRFQNLDERQQALLSAYLGRRIMGRIERRVLLHTISRLWIDYLTDIEDLRRGIGLEAYGQRDPLVEYKRRAFELFEELGDNIRRTVARSMFRQPPEPLRSQ
jgi:hypothetical protein